MIVIGMHRSGTSALAGRLQDGGVFMGSKLDNNAESLFFKRMNEWMLRLCGGSWEHPLPIDVLDGQPELRAILVRQLERALSAPISMNFFGAARWMRYRGQRRLGFAWGWKDPRNTFTLPIWLELFPDARIINVERHGIDVALSLRNRFVKQKERAGKAVESENSMLLMRRRQLVGLEGLRGANLEDGLLLWSEYMRRGRRHCETLGERAMTVRFEELMLEPEQVLQRVAKFAGVAEWPDEHRLDPSRAYAWEATQTQELKDLLARHQGLLREFGY